MEILSLDANTLVKLVKKAALDAVKAGAPADIVHGEVVSVSPVKIKIDQKIILPESMLIPTSAVVDRDIYLEALPQKVGHTTELTTCETAHSHVYMGGIFRLHLALGVGEKVILLRRAGGQKYIVLDRELKWGVPNG